MEEGKYTFQILLFLCVEFGLFRNNGIHSGLFLLSLIGRSIVTTAGCFAVSAQVTSISTVKANRCCTAIGLRCSAISRKMP